MSRRRSAMRPMRPGRRHGMLTPAGIGGLRRRLRAPTPPRSTPRMLVAIALADDSPPVRQGASRILGADARLRVVAACPDLPSLLEAIDRHTPDVVVTDIRMPTTNTGGGIRLASRLRERHPDIGVFVLSNFAEPEYVL